MISVIITNFNQLNDLQKTLSALVADKNGHEVLVVDGGSSDGTQSWLKDRPWVRLIQGAGPRGTLLNQGVREATGDTLFFLSPGACPNRFWSQTIEQTFPSQGEFVGSGKGFTEGHHPAIRLANLGAAWRRRVLKLPLTSDGLVISAKTVADYRGFMETAVCEDAEYVQRLSKQGVRIISLNLRVRNQGRLYSRDGAWLRLARNRRTLQGFLRGDRGTDLQRAFDGERRAVHIWYGRDQDASLNQRLGKYLDEDKALSADRALTRCFIRRANTSMESPRVVLTAEAETGGEQLRDHFGDEMDIQYVDGGSLGTRIRSVFEQDYLRGLEKVLLIDPVCPELSRALMNQAFQGLNEHDFVFGPTDDGECYLIAARKGKAALLEEVDWAGPSSFHAATRVAHANSASYLVLPRLHDLDDAEDFRRFYYMGYIGG